VVTIINRANLFETVSQPAGTILLGMELARAYCMFRAIDPRDRWRQILWMASRPVLRELERYVESNGGDSFVLDRIAAGESVGRIAKSITLPKHGPISRPLLYAWRNRGDERRKGWALAMKASAEALSEDAGDCWDVLSEDPTSAQVAKARGMSEYKRWLASVRDRDAFGSSSGAVSVNLNVGSLHLDALRQVGHMRALPGDPEPRLIEAEVVE
jgi:hypothetical protein